MERAGPGGEPEDDGAAIDLLVGEDEPDEDAEECGEEAAPPGSGESLPGAVRSMCARWEKLSPAPILDIPLRRYQESALSAWLESRGRGLIVLPTGAGKTIVALGAMARLGIPTLVVVPTLELLKQWSEAIGERLQLPPESVGRVGGGERHWRPVTVATYDSAWRKSRELKPFGLLVFDEAHHLPSTCYRRVAQQAPAPFRLGLSATPERADERHSDLDRLIGPVVFRRSPAELVRTRHIARFRQERIFVNLTDQEEYEYHHLMSRFRWYMARSRIWGGGFQQLVVRAAVDPGAREALRSHQQARQIALNAAAKAGEVLSLLRQHAADRVLVFCEYTSVVDSLSRRLLLPSITYRTPAVERRLTLQRFRAGVYTKLVTGRVLNEGVDVPDANVAIVVSGSSIPREQIQRLGRVLRPKKDEAVLYEIIARGTSEERSARARKVRE